MEVSQPTASDRLRRRLRGAEPRLFPARLRGSARAGAVAAGPALARSPRRWRPPLPCACCCCSRWTTRSHAIRWSSSPCSWSGPERSSLPHPPGRLLRRLEQQRSKVDEIVLPDNPGVDAGRLHIGDRHALRLQPVDQPVVGLAQGVFRAAGNPQQTQVRGLGIDAGQAGLVGRPCAAELRPSTQANLSGFVRPMVRLS